MNKKALWLGLAAVILAAATAGIIYQRHSKLKAAALEDRKVQTESYVLSRAASIKPADLQSPSREKIFAGLWASIQSSEYVRIKVWDPNFTIIYSDLPELIGQKFSDNDEVKEGYEGNTSLELEGSKDLKTEHFSERDYAELTETYVPLKDNGKTFLVIEVYQDTTNLNSMVRTQTISATWPFAAAALAVWAILAIFIIRFHKHNS